MPFLHCKNKLKRAQNVQNSEFAYYASKSGKWIKQTPTPPFWGDVGVKKWSRFFDSGTRKPIFGHLKMGTFAKSAHFQVPENGTSSARIKKLRPLFHANIPPKWWSRCLFYTFTTFGRVIGKFWILKISPLKSPEIPIKNEKIARCHNFAGKIPIPFAMT